MHTGDKDHRVAEEAADQTSTSDHQNSMVGRGHHEDEYSHTVNRNHRVAVNQTSASDCMGSSVETINVLTQTETGLATQSLLMEHPPKEGSEVMALPALSWKKFMRNLHDDQIEQICIIVATDDVVDIRERISTLQVENIGKEVPNDQTKARRFEARSWESLKANSPFYEVLLEYADVFPEEVPSELPKDKRTRHEIHLVPGTKYCVTRQWTLPPRRKSGQVRESISPHSTPTFCVKKSTGGWRIVHAYNKLNAATVPAQTPIPRKDVIIDGMCGSTSFSALDLRDGFYQILMREKDIPLTAISTPSGMLWEWLVMPQGLRNAPATFNRCVMHLLRPVREFAPSYFDDVFIHSKGKHDKSDVDVHREHLRRV
ncbi:hypothetical protein PsorP6_000441 [Peronosclerospora sorghi]|uniref:Uncharacterized protein n=1 Tax=Peronosclerospora sorghi TaxID=230839 RepID=A0ACC0WWP5_9STRA|nr:hypothetical protein PsorP6_000441 [Peronosclerospora sorghi]